MMTKYLKVSVACILFFAMVSATPATVEWDIIKSLKIDAIPLDVEVSPDGKHIFVLTDQGSILIFTSNGMLTDKVDVGTHVDQIRVAPDGEQLFAASRANKTLDIIKLDFIHKIDTSRAPFRGPVQAPVVIAVFSDFQ